ncbi:MAG: alpha/beta hydrolase fold domain-containing protein [Pseudomonadota bacterium]
MLKRLVLGIIILSSAITGCSDGSGSAPSVSEVTATSPPQPASPPPPVPPVTTATNVESETDISYGNGLVLGSSLTLLLDIYQPDDACVEPRPFVVGIHGGGFVGGSKSDGSWVANMDAIVAEGFAGISIDYRLVGDRPLVSAEFQPVLDDLNAEADRLGLTDRQREVLNAAVAAIEDTVAALKWARSNAQRRCLDMDRFAIWGSSAGAITALHVAHGLDEYFISRPEPLVVIDYWGRLLLDGLVDADGPPFMIIHGTEDNSQVYEETAVVLAAEAEAEGLPFSFYTIEGGPHGFRNVDPNFVQINGEDARDVTLDFISDHLLGQTPIYEVQTINTDG